VRLRRLRRLRRFDGGGGGGLFGRVIGQRQLAKVEDGLALAGEVDEEHLIGDLDDLPEDDVPEVERRPLARLARAILLRSLLLVALLGRPAAAVDLRLAVVGVRGPFGTLAVLDVGFVVVVFLGTLGRLVA
jgi:hypothetical protein